jgi:hypothetical protein
LDVSGQRGGDARGSVKLKSTRGVDARSKAAAQASRPQTVLANLSGWLSNVFNFTDPMRALMLDMELLLTHHRYIEAL